MQEKETAKFKKKILEEIVPKITRYSFGESDWFKIKIEIFYFFSTEDSKKIKELFTKKRKKSRIGEKHQFNDFEKEIFKVYKDLTGVQLEYENDFECKPKSNFYSLTDEEVKQIKERVWDNENRHKIAKDFNLVLHQVSKIEYGKAYAHVPNPKREKKILRDKKFKKPKKRGPKRKGHNEEAIRRLTERIKKLEIRSTKNKLVPDEVREIKKKLLNGEKISNLAKEYGVCSRTIHYIKDGTRWGHIKVE